MKTIDREGDPSGQVIGSWTAFKSYDFYQDLVSVAVDPFSYPSERVAKRLYSIIFLDRDTIFLRENLSVILVGIGCQARPPAGQRLGLLVSG